MDWWQCLGLHFFRCMYDFSLELQQKLPLRSRYHLKERLNCARYRCPSLILNVFQRSVMTSTFGLQNVDFLLVPLWAQVNSKAFLSKLWSSATWRGIKNSNTPEHKARTEREGPKWSRIATYFASLNHHSLTFSLSTVSLSEYQTWGTNGLVRSRADCVGTQRRRQNCSPRS